MIYLISCLFTILFVYYSKYQFRDLSTGRDTRWKKYGMMMRILVFVGCFLTQYLPVSSWQDYVLAGALNIFLFDILINIIALNKHILYIGVTGEIDVALGKYKWYIYTIILITSLLIKILLPK